MEKKQVSALVPEKKDAEGNIKQAGLGPVTVEVDFYETLDEAKEAGKEEALISNAFANGRVTIQSGIRSALKRGEAPEEIINRYASWQLGVAQTGGKIDAEAAYRAKFLAASPEERKGMIEMLRKLAAK